MAMITATGTLRDSPAPAPDELRPGYYPHEISCSDSRLVAGCLQGDEQAWCALIDKYKNLIYSVPVRWGFAPSDASDIFQAVIADLLSDLGTLRNSNAVAGWLIRVTTHKCTRLKQLQRREVGEDGENFAGVDLPGTETPERLLRVATNEQALRQALYSASPRCRELIHKLFYERPTRPYAEVAESLGIAVGSVGFIRRRCLERLKHFLEEAGFTAIDLA
jgi:RNA polymerase sigma factor (sigma-70 family)